MSADGPSAGERLRSLRPWFLVAAMILTWLIGVQGVTTGCTTTAYLREGSMPDEVAALEHAKAHPQPGHAAIDFASVTVARAVAENGRVMLPLSIAQTLLSMLLVAASAMVLAGRPGSRSFALQVLAANAVFALAGYLLTQDLREQWITAAVVGSRELSLPPEDQVFDTFLLHSSRSASFWFWLTALKLAVLELGVLGLAGMALQARRTRTFLEASARAGERREREDEP